MTKLPLIAVTMGDPTGIGPEIIVKTFAQPEFHHLNRAIVIGDPHRLALAMERCGIHLKLRRVDRSNQVTLEAGVLNVQPCGSLPPDLPFGRLHPAAGEAAFRYVERAVQLALRGEVDAVATAPLNKEAMHLAGFKYPGHTEILAHLTDTHHYAMMLVAENLRVIHVTTHVSMHEALSRIRRERVLAVIRLAQRTLRHLGIETPRIAVAGINPHAGENGLFGREEIEQVEPAVRDAISEGIEASGPWPGDTVFVRARRGEFDMVVAQYHDQGHIPVKLLGFDTGVNVTVGLPFFRTSVDHGTAFDIAGSGAASADSMRAAIDLATRLAVTHPGPA